MVYGPNLLTTVVADWQITNGTMTTESITLTGDGRATQTVDLTKLSTIPDTIMLSVVASVYADPYKAGIMAILKAVTESGLTHTYHIPIVDTGGGVCSVELPVSTLSHEVLTFTLVANRQVTFTDWALFTPKVTDVDLTEVLDKMPRLLKDYNMAQVTVGTVEDTIAMISSYITETTEITGSLTIAYKASEDCRMIIRIKDNDTTELYTPMIFYLHSGAGSVSVPHAYLSRTKGYHNFTVTAQVTNGTIEINTRQIFYVIDGGRLMYSLLDVGSVVYDISAKKTEQSSKVSHVYAICIDDGICLVKKSEYTDTPGAAWISEAVLGPAIDAAIEFNGTWDLSRTPYPYNTDENPVVAVVTTDNILKAQWLHDESTLIDLSTGVSKVCSVKGWNNEYTKGYDHGLLFVYVKTNGTVWYRGYCLQADGSYMWEVERQLSAFTGTAVDVNAFKTNDFRIGINVLDSSGATNTYLTYRNWAGMSFKPEHIAASVVDPVFIVTPITYHDTGTNENVALSLAVDVFDVCPSTYLTSSQAITYSKRISDYTIQLTLNYPLLNVAGSHSLFAVAGKTVTSVAAGPTDRDIIITVAEQLPSVGVFNVTYTKAHHGIKIVVTNYCTPTLEAFTVAAHGDPPNHIENIQAFATNPVLTVTRVYHSYPQVQEQVTASVANPVLTVTKVGSNPL